ncbi:MAG: enoyl-CoA hydratase/isomerase family protein [Candidatus Rokubacteria bacterium]|nr:enoyl-CoA hydratase/isomerase family protein [Candidatus Rokubacteria bacterium]
MSPAGDELLFAREPPLAYVTFNRPQARNALTWAMYEALHAACDAVDADPDLRVMILRGAGGRAFAAGTDITQFQAFRTAADGLAYERMLDGVIARVEAVRRPVIAAVAGVATGGGASLALACDLRYCTPESQFGIPIARTLGNCLSSANHALLVDLLGPARTKELIFRARLVGAEEARGIGLVNEVVPAGRLEDRVRAIALEIASHAPITLRVTKESLRRLARHRRAPDTDDLVGETYASEDFREGVAAFLAKRLPVFKDR